MSFARDSINELRVKHVTTEKQSPSRSKATRCVLSHNSSLHEYILMKASFQRMHSHKQLLCSYLDK